MNIEKAKALGYEVIQASPFEVELVDLRSYQELTRFAVRLGLAELDV
jgi:hypothetical protein